MKKIVLFSLMCCIGGTYALPVLAGACGAKSIDISGALGINQGPTDGEFLYTDPADQKQLQKDVDGTGNYKINSYALECDDEYCSRGTVVYLPDGGIAGNTNGKYFMCNMSAVNDFWTPIGECRDGQEVRKPYHDFYVARKNSVQKRNNMTDYKIYDTYSSVFPCVCNGDVYDHDGKQFCRVKGSQGQGSQGQNPGTNQTPGNGTNPVMSADCPDGTTRATKDIEVIKVCSGDKCVAIRKDQCYPTDFLKCMEAADRGEPANWNGKSCNCGDRMVWDNKNYKCVAKAGGSVVNPKTCKEQRKTQNGKACCDLPATQAEYDAKNDKCNCLNKSAEFKIESGKGQCVVKETEPVVENCRFECKVQAMCNGSVTSFAKTIDLTTEILKGKTCTDFKQQFETNLQICLDLLGDPCTSGQTTPQAPVVTGPTQEQINSAQKVLSDFTTLAKDEASVWKTAEGKFNTTRLASDITAGVVLGTVGGVVTGNVIKKNQVKKGFEALHCTVGGQTVADWGDEFNVGLRR